MTSQKQFEANRRKALKRTEPRMDHGAPLDSQHPPHGRVLASTDRAARERPGIERANHDHLTGHECILIIYPW